MRSVSAAADTVEVRVRYRPVGDVLTIVVQADGRPPGRRFQAELDDGTLTEWRRLDDGDDLLCAIQVIGTGSVGSVPAAPPPILDRLPEPLRAAALDVMSPGHRHNHHPSTRRPLRPTDAREITIRTPIDSIDRQLLEPRTRPEPSPSG